MSKFPRHWVKYSPSSLSPSPESPPSPIVVVSMSMQFQINIKIKINRYTQVQVPKMRWEQNIVMSNLYATVVLTWNDTYDAILEQPSWALSWYLRIWDFFFAIFLFYLLHLLVREYDFKTTVRPCARFFLFCLSDTWSTFLHRPYSTELQCY